MGAWRGATTKLGHRTHRTRALDVGTDARGFSDDDAGFDYKRGIPSKAAPGTPEDGLAEVQGQIAARGAPAPKSVGGAK